MAKRKSTSRVPVVDQFKQLFYQVIKETRKLGNKSTAQIPVYQEAVDYANRNKIPGAIQLLSATLLRRQEQAEEALKSLEGIDGQLPQSLLGHLYYVNGFALDDLSAKMKQLNTTRRRWVRMVTTHQASYLTLWDWPTWRRATTIALSSATRRP